MARAGRGRLGQHPADRAGQAHPARGRPAGGAAGRPDPQQRPGHANARRSGRARCGSGTTARWRWNTCSGPARSAPARRINFERQYDLMERILPPADRTTSRPRIRPTPSGSWSGSPLGRSGSPPSRTWATTSGCPGPPPSCGSPSWSRQWRTAAGLGAGLAGAGLPLAGRPPAAPDRGPGTAQPVRPADLVPRPGVAACSASTTGSRSTPRPRSGCTATTCCRSCSASSWWPGWT